MYLHQLSTVLFFLIYRSVSYQAKFLQKQENGPPYEPEVLLAYACPQKLSEESRARVERRYVYI
jgi:hypothetical protein